MRITPRQSGTVVLLMPLAVVLLFDLFWIPPAAYGQQFTSFEFTSPAGGESLTANTTVLITWTSVNPTGYVDLTLQKAGEDYAAIGYTLMEANRFEWEVCPVLPAGNDYAVRMSGQDAHGNEVELTSALFSITGSVPAPTLAVTVPAAGASWANGVSQAITWTASNGNGHVYIDLLRGGTFERTIGYAAVADGQFVWRPCNLSSTDYAVRLSMDGCGPGIEATSGLFSITGGAGGPIGIQIASPGGGETLTAGTPMTVSFSCSDPAAILTIELLQGESFHSHLGLIPGSFNAFVATLCPQIGDAADYRVRLRTTDGCGSLSEVRSGPFTIIGSQARPTLAVTSPQSVDVWAQGTVQTILWQQTGATGTAVVGLVKDGVWRATLGFPGVEAGSLGWEIAAGLPDSLDNQIEVRLPLCRGAVEGVTERFALRSGPAMLQADADADTDVDLDDFAKFQTCYSGAGHAQAAAACRHWDFDNDGDVDPADFARFDACHTRAAVPQPDVDCDRP